LQASATYGLAIECVASSGIEALLVGLYLNRAAAYTKLNSWDDVIEDCTRALVISPGHPKCLQRRAMAYERAARPMQALEDYIQLRGEEVSKQQKDCALSLWTPLAEALCLTTARYVDLLLFSCSLRIFLLLFVCLLSLASSLSHAHS
jgi:tetratricopeptide (TPR) repeat protein